MQALDLVLDLVLDTDLDLDPLARPSTWRRRPLSARPRLTLTRAPMLAERSDDGV